MNEWNPLRMYVLWVRQGRPTDRPVIVKPGRLFVCPHGSLNVNGWHWSHKYQTRDADVSDYADYLSSQYPVERVGYMKQCELGCNTESALEQAIQSLIV